MIYVEQSYGDLSKIQASNLSDLAAGKFSSPHFNIQYRDLFILFYAAHLDETDIEFDLLHACICLQSQALCAILCLTKK